MRQLSSISAINSRSSRQLFSLSPNPYPTQNTKMSQLAPHMHMRRVKHAFPRRRTRTHTCACTHTCTHACTHVRMRSSAHTCMHIDAGYGCTVSTCNACMEPYDKFAIARLGEPAILGARHPPPETAVWRHACACVHIHTCIRASNAEELQTGVETFQPRLMGHHPRGSVPHAHGQTSQRRRTHTYIHTYMRGHACVGTSG